MKNFNYKSFQSALNNVGLSLEPSPTENGFEIKLVSLLEKGVIIINKRKHESVSKTGDSEETVAKAIFEKIKNKRIFIGSRASYTSIVEWSGQENKFFERNLSSDEIRKYVYPL